MTATEYKGSRDRAEAIQRSPGNPQYVASTPSKLTNVLELVAIEIIPE